jgi:nucleoside-diphosphate-sugar epimerase
MNAPMEPAARIFVAGHGGLVGSALMRRLRAAGYLVATRDQLDLRDCDTDKPDGTPQKLLDVSRLHALGWRHRIDLHQGIAQTYEWFLAQSMVFA